MPVVFSFFFFGLRHCFSPISECVVGNGAVFLKSLGINHPSCLRLTCTTRWHFKDITGNWLYGIYFFNLLLKYNVHIEKCTLNMQLSEFSQAEHVCDQH